MNSRYTFRYSIIIYLLLFTALSVIGQCDIDRHNTTWYDGWISCEQKASPNGSRGKGHWLLYELGYTYKLGATHFWNHNVPYSLDQGAKTIAIDYSMDGLQWTEFGTISLAKATGLSTYSGEEGPSLNGVDAKYVLITVLENYGGPCAGISEVKFDVQFVSSSLDDAQYSQCVKVQAFPNPFRNNLQVSITNHCGGYSTIFITDVSGRTVSPKYNVKNFKETISISLAGLPNGVYTLHSITGDHTIIEKIIKIE
jgi:hypothetical protein